MSRLAGWRRALGVDGAAYAFVVLGTAAFVVYEKFLCIGSCPVGFLVHGETPNSILGIGIVEGALQALPALALVLVFRTNRVVNFAQGDLGAFAATLAGSLILFAHWPYFPALAVAIAAAAVVSALVELTVVRYFFNAPRLIVTVATIGVAQILAAVQLVLPSFFDRRGVLGITALPEPFNFRLDLDRIHTFGASDLLVVGISPLVAAGLFVLLRYTSLGAAIRASSEDVQRARGLGIPAKRLSTLVWVLAGVVSAFASVLSGNINGFAFGILVGPGFLLRSIAPATIGRFDNLGLTFAAAIGLGIVEQAFLFQTGADGPVEVLVFVIILGALVLRAPKLGRRALTESSTWQLLREVRPIPREIRHLPEVRALTLGVPLVALLALIVLPAVAQPDQLASAESILEYAMVGISLVILSGWAGQVSLGQWAIAGVGAIVAAQLFMSAHIDFIASLALGAIAAAVVAAVLGLPSLRIGGYFLAVATLGFAIASAAFFFTVHIDTTILGRHVVFIDLPKGVARPTLFGIWNGYIERNFYWFVLAAFVASFVVATNFRRGRAGRSLVAMRDNEVAGSALGLTPMRLKLVAFVLSGFIAGIAGGLYGFTNTVVLENTAITTSFPPAMGLFLFAIVVFGGLGSPAGAALGAAIIFGIQTIAGDYAFLATGAGILVMLYVCPAGLGQVLYDYRDSILREMARRRGIEVPALLGAEDEEEARLSPTALPEPAG